MPFSVGRFTLHEIRDARYAVDGGVMFGPVWRQDWAPAYPFDDQNRVGLMSRLLLLDDGERRVLVDVGLGEKLSVAEQQRWAVDRTGFDVDRELARAGTSREAITDVILTNLHREHAGGITSRGAEGELELTFPNATFHLQRRQFRWAHHPSERDAASFCREDFALLEQCGRLHLCEGDTEILEGVEVCVSEGHTVGQQLVHVRDDEVEVLCAGDLLPTVGHLRLAWQMSSDLYPLACLEEKKMLLAQAVESNAVLFLPHEPGLAACRLREEEGAVLAGEPIAF